MRILVTGGRDFDDRVLAFRELDAIHSVTPVITMIHGAASGADTLADEWAKTQGVAIVSCPADWKRHGRAAGPIRNREMLEQQKPDLVVAFPGGKGTANMISLAKRAGVQVIDISSK